MVFMAIEQRTGRRVWRTYTEELRWQGGLLGVSCRYCETFVPVVEEGRVDACPSCGHEYRVTIQERNPRDDEGAQ